MSNSIESGQSPEQLFESAKFTIQKNLLQSPLIPKGPRSQIDNLLRNRTVMLPDHEFVKEARRTGATGVENYDVDPTTTFEDVLAMHIQEYITGEEDKIIMRKGVVTDSESGEADALGGLLEEVAHAYRSKPIIAPLLSVPEDSLKMRPFSSYVQIEDFLNTNHERFQTSDEPVSLENVDVVSMGFLSIMQENRSEDLPRIIHPGMSAQHGLEEARAGAIQAIFAAKIKGTSLRPFGSLRDQLSYGFDDLFRNSEAIHFGQQFGLIILSDILRKSVNIADTSKEFLAKSYELDVDQFAEYLQEKSQQSRDDFFSIVDIFDKSKQT